MQRESCVNRKTNYVFLIARPPAASRTLSYVVPFAESTVIVAPATSVRQNNVGAHAMHRQWKHAGRR
eukprot:7910167-Alexandrium_andersonii.AAC.1